MSEIPDPKPAVKILSGRGGGKDRARRPGQTEAPKMDRCAAARAIFEGTPGSTCETVAAEVGVPVGTVRWWKSQGKWMPAVRALPDLSARAGALANTFRTKMSDLGKPLDDKTAADEVARELAIGHATDVRADVIDRHRKEWSAPRAIAYQAIKEGQTDVSKGFERAKLAKITSETLTLIQAGECRAFGINQEARGADGRSLVLIERESAPAPEPAEPVPAQIEPTPGTDTGTGTDEDTF